jgi:hypothetical protein
VSQFHVFEFLNLLACHPYTFYPLIKFLIRLDINYFYVVHESGKGLMSYARGRPTKDRKSATTNGFECTLAMSDKISELRTDHNMHEDTKMLLFILVFRPGKTVNSYRRNHDIMGMLPIPPKAVERGLAPPDLFPHKSSAKTPVLSYGVSHQKQTPYPPNLQNRDHEFNAPLFLWPCSRRWTTRGNGHTDR